MYIYDATQGIFCRNVHFMDLLVRTEIFDEDEGRFVCVTGEEEEEGKGWKKRDGKENNFAEVMVCVRLRAEAPAEEGVGEEKEVPLATAGGQALTLKSKNAIWRHLHVCLGGLDEKCWQ